MRLPDRLGPLCTLLACLAATPAYAAVHTPPQATKPTLIASDEALLRHGLIAPPAIPPAAEAPRRGPRGRAIDLEIHGGAIIPGGNFYGHAKTDGVYGAGLGKEFALSRAASLRGTVTYSRAMLHAKPADLTGHVTINAIVLRVDLLLLPGKVRPYVGAGPGVFPWRGTIRKPSADQTNSRASTDFGGLVSAGLDVAVTNHLSLSPELSWTRISGQFSQMLWSTAIAARWRF